MENDTEHERFFSQPHVVLPQEVPQPYLATAAAAAVGLEIPHHHAVFQPPPQAQPPPQPQPRYKMIQVAVPASVASQITSGAQRYQLVPMAAMAPPPQPPLPPPPLLPQPMVAAPMVSLPLLQQQQQQPVMQQPCYPPPGSVLVPMYPF